MDPVALKANGYPGTYKLIGGRLSLDLINTISWPGTEREHDWLSPAQNLSEWMKAAALDGAGKPPTIAVARPVRTTLSNVIRPLAHGQRPSPKSIRELSRQISDAMSRRVLDSETLQWRFTGARHPLGALGPVLLDASDLITNGTSRLKFCAACDWLFEDQSKNRSRRWCDMSDCGSREKSANYYRRSQS